MSGGTRIHAAAPSAGELLAGRARGAAPPTGNPCWRESYDVDDPEMLRFVHGVDREEMGAFLAVVEQHNSEAKQAGRRSGPLRQWGTAIMRHLWREAIANKGVCAPSQAQIAQALRIARSTVQLALDALFDAGVLEWRRRTIKEEGEAGPIRRQTTNLYRFVLPKALAWRVSKMLLKRGRKPGLPRSIAAALTPAEVARRARQAAEAREKRRRRRTPLEGALALIGRGLGLSPSPNMRPS